jgi:hypothetical protein
MTKRQNEGDKGCAPLQLALYGICALLPELALPSALPEKPLVTANSHLRAAERHAGREPDLRTIFRHACAAKSAPKTVEEAVSAVRKTEAVFHNERAQATPDQTLLTRAVVLRGCAAYHATRLQPGASYPLWLLSSLKVTQMGLVNPPGKGWWVEAQARNLNGPVANSRLTFSQGAHMSCFGATDAQGVVRCTLQDTHPHGPGPLSAAEVAAHKGPVIATLAGSVSASRIELPTVTERPMPSGMDLLEAYKAAWASRTATPP